MFSILNRGLSWAITSFGNKFCLKKRTRLIKALDNRFHVKFMQLEIGLFCRIKGCGGAGWPPPPIIFERLKLPQQIIYRRKGNLSESPNHQKYWENILISRFYEQFSRSSRILGHFWKFEKILNS